MSDKNLAEEFSHLLLEPKNTFEAYFLEFYPCTSIVHTESEFSCHMIRIDVNGKDRTEAIANMVSRRIISYAIPRSEMAKAQKLDIEENTASHVLALGKKAQSLFTDLKQTGECGEMLLYLFANAYLKAPQVLCKMPFKTSSKLHYQGIDGLHAKYDEENDCFLLFWGEAKVYSNISDAFTECFNSIAGILLSNWGSTDPAERDLQLFRDNIDFDNPEMESLVLNFLDVDNPKRKKKIKKRRSMEHEEKEFCISTFRHGGRYPVRPGHVHVPVARVGRLYPRRGDCGGRRGGPAGFAAGPPEDGGQARCPHQRQGGGRCAAGHCGRFGAGRWHVHGHGVGHAGPRHRHGRGGHPSAAVLDSFGKGIKVR